MGAREISGTTICLIVRYVREHAGDDGVARLLRIAGEHRHADELEDEHTWSTYEQRNALFVAASVVLNDPAVSRRIAESALDHRVGAGLRILLRALGSPRRLFANIERVAAKFSNVGTMEALELGQNRATIARRLDPPKVPHRLDCEYTVGLFRVVGPLFGLPPLTVQHDECQVDGADRCIYRVSWTRPRRVLWRRRKGLERAHLEERLSALTGQLESLQSTAADLVSSDDLDVVLGRIVHRAAAAVSAPRYLLAVRTAEDTEPRVHFDGFDPGAAHRAAAELLVGDLPVDDSRRLVIPVSSARRDYGALAAFSDRQAFFPDERDLLAAYARSAAAALDVATALDEARRRGETAAMLLTLARALADVSTPELVAATVAEAMPVVTGCAAAAVLLLDDEAGTLSVRAHHGWSDEHADEVAGLVLQPGEAPGLAALLASPEPTVVATAAVRSPAVRDLLVQLDVPSVALVPIASRGALLGLAVATFGDHEVDGRVEDRIERMRAVADQAATALENGHLLERIREQALHDGLTGLPNRLLFEEHVGQAIARSRRAGTGAALLFVDLDRFKRINDNLGHDAGDLVLREVATRLEATARRSDVVARMGGDEFTLLLVETDAAGAVEIAERVLGVLSRPIEVHGRPIHVSASIGIATFPDDGDTYDDLLRRADLAMYGAKDRGRNTWRRYASELGAPGRSQLDLEAELRVALTREELELAYRPRVDLWTGEVEVVDAVVRWRHHTLGLLGPERFVAVADEAGLGRALDAWILRRACTDARTWQDAHERPPRVSVRLAPSRLRDPELAGFVLDTSSSTGLTPDRLELCVDGRALLDAGAEPLAALEELRAAGARVAVGDGGGEYAVLGRLRDLPADSVKIDGARSADGTPPERDGVIAAIVARCRSLGLRVVADGVGSEADVALLRRHDCDAVSGSHVARPVGSAAVPALVAHPLLAPHARAPRGPDARAVPDGRHAAPTAR